MRKLVSRKHYLVGLTNSDLGLNDFCLVAGRVVSTRVTVGVVLVSVSVASRVLVVLVALLLLVSGGGSLVDV